MNTRKTLTLALSVIAFGLATPRIAAAQVSLVRATAYVHTKYGMSQYSRTFDIRVQNLAYDKQVFVRHQKTDGSWTDLAASYVGTLDAGYELWRASYNVVGTALGSQFAVAYTVNGATYWDNNGGANFVLHDNDGALLGRGINVLTSYASVSSYGTPGQFGVTIDVRNLAYSKTVQVVYTTDNWQTTSTVNASYVSSYSYGYAYVQSPNSIGFERWVVQGVQVPQTGSLLFYVKYTVNGQTYYDSNFGRNYNAYAF